MRVHVDRERCQGIGQCESLAPDVFEIGDDGLVGVHHDAVAEADRALVERAVRACPTAALSVTDD